MSFANLDLHPALAATIADRGYQQPTSVQRAVLDASSRDRDLLVSAPTGSGKTLAFGALLARSLLDETERSATASSGPAGVVIAPTRELAAQVSGELSWLFARTPLRIAAFTGGSDVRRDLRMLHGRVDLVVGTPGRLVDLQERGALRLDAVRCVVLDEADEMLDMGFREDLEKILGAAAARTRTLMFSATLPRPILGLATRYQRDPLRLNLQSAAAGAAGHEDIEFIAHLIGVGDRMAAVVNVLTRSTARRAIVFGTTRAGVGELHRELVRRGFKAVVLSGDRVQAERNRALDALRQGEVRVLVATNVAARGLDVPEVDLIVHAELPLDVEALTHRSGRTGRAGRKGTSVIIATIAERRKAERLMSAAGLKVQWTPAPSAGEIRNAAQAALEDELVSESVDAGLVGMTAAREMAARLVQKAGKDELIAALLRRELGRLPAGEEIEKVELRPFVPTPRPTGPRIGRAEFSRDAVRFRINLGLHANAQPTWLLPLICRRGGVTRREVGAIRIGPEQSEFEIAGGAAADFALAAAQPDPRAPHVVIERVEGGRVAPSRPEHAPPRPPRDGRVPPRPPRDGRVPPRPPRDGQLSPRPRDGTLPPPRRQDKRAPWSRPGVEQDHEPRAQERRVPFWQQRPGQKHGKFRPKKRG